jgi:uncharacterized protein YceK
VVAKYSGADETGILLAVHLRTKGCKKLLSSTNPSDAYKNHKACQKVSRACARNPTTAPLVAAAEWLCLGWLCR